MKPGRVIHAVKKGGGKRYPSFFLEGKKLSVWFGKEALGNNIAGEGGATMWYVERTSRGGGVYPAKM